MNTEHLFSELQIAVQRLLEKNQQLTTQLATLQEQHELLQLEMLEKDEQQAQLTQNLQTLLTSLSDTAAR
ncbi:hypothetical protein [Alishewanella tabrizica]|uniref:DUF904 domain-containing protein n=1 Tax=Alishewanella tabrizica TaxID=671278 RepID=A0ABQ2WL97_9ALTE|nr:hypothetical protein [Alishewanella tabrizica]GGW57551.1 hypothetical protein GCM10008111_12030 [Alishewanella tabrizica]